MTDINNDILDAMDADPRLAEALRERILTRELMQLPSVVQGLSNRVDLLSNRLEVVSGNVETLASNVGTLTGHFGVLSEAVQQLASEQRTFNEGVIRAIDELRIANKELMASNAELRISNEETKIATANSVRRMDRMEQDSRFLKNFSTTMETRMYIESVADDMGLHLC